MGIMGNVVSIFKKKAVISHDSIKLDVDEYKELKMISDSPLTKHDDVLYYYVDGKLGIMVMGD